MRRMFAMLVAGALAVAGGAAWAQSTATPDTGSALSGISTGKGRGRTGAGQGQSGTTRQDEGGPANTEKPAAGTGGQTASRPPTGAHKPASNANANEAR